MPTTLEGLTAPIWIRERDAQTGARPREGIDIKDLPFYDAERGIMLRAAIGVTTAAAHSPRHRHTFDQVRYFIAGRTRFGSEVYGPGDCLYFPEGAYYGPQESYEGEDCLHIALQFPGPSGIPYPNPVDQARAVEELKAQGGSFEKGIYRGPDGRPQDGFDAVLEHLTGEPVVYPSPRIPSPVALRTAAYAWSDHALPGVAVKHLAHFNETGPNIKLVRLEPGASTPAATSHYQELRFVLEGAVSYEGEDFGAITCGYLPAGVEHAETVGASDDGALLLVVQLAVPGGDPPPHCRL